MSELEQEVDNRNSPVRCPACGEHAVKLDKPSQAMPALLQRPVEVLPGVFGKAICQNAECSAHRDQTPIWWWYKREGV